MRQKKIITRLAKMFRELTGEKDFIKSIKQAKCYINNPAMHEELAEELGFVFNWELGGNFIEHYSFTGEIYDSNDFGVEIPREFFVLAEEYRKKRGY